MKTEGGTFGLVLYVPEKKKKETFYFSTGLKGIAILNDKYEQICFIETDDWVSLITEMSLRNDCCSSEKHALAEKLHFENKK